MEFLILKFANNLIKLFRIKRIDEARIKLLKTFILSLKFNKTFIVISKRVYTYNKYMQ